MIDLETLLFLLLDLTGKRKDTELILKKILFFFLCFSKRKGTEIARKQKNILNLGTLRFTNSFSDSCTHLQDLNIVLFFPLCFFDTKILT